MRRSSFSSQGKNSSLVFVIWAFSMLLSTFGRLGCCLCTSAIGARPPHCNVELQKVPIRSPQTTAVECKRLRSIHLFSLPPWSPPSLVSLPWEHNYLASVHVTSAGGRLASKLPRKWNGLQGPMTHGSPA